MTSQRESAVVPGIATRLASAVLRVTAPNASLLTGPGTNSYLVGERDCAVLDPGPDIEKHVDALIASAPGPVRWIVLTHTHPDHSPAATRLKRATGASIVGTVAPQDGRQDYATRLDRIVRDGESVGAAGHELLAIATPGHASNHICYLHAASGLLFSGDHILNGSTTVILAPDGDMAQYLASLERLRHVGMSGIAPGHGAVLTEPLAAVEGLIAHRLRREAKAVDRLRAAGRVSLAELVPRVYDDVTPALHGFARHSLEAHLIKLERERRVERDGEFWSVRDPAQ
ncbi:MAG TPA: MBL fold metallo-hydrolase [Steroidobacteraceae bacterium]|nr:MBL fold metallo-hydrolase [Steroidobacteraceae bacterium]